MALKENNLNDDKEIIDIESRLIEDIDKINQKVKDNWLKKDKIK